MKRRKLLTLAGSSLLTTLASGLSSEFQADSAQKAVPCQFSGWVILAFYLVVGVRGSW
jgi:ABC-type phosphate transport system substrate-binding protein